MVSSKLEGIFAKGEFGIWNSTITSGGDGVLVPNTSPGGTILNCVIASSSFQIGATGGTAAVSFANNVLGGGGSIDPNVIQQIINSQDTKGNLIY